MKKRIITATVALAIFIPILIFSSTTVGKYIFTTVMAALAVIGIFELAGCIGLRRQFAVMIPTYIYAVAIMFLVVFMPSHTWTFKISLAMSFVYIFYAFCYSMLSSGNIRMGQTSELVAVSGYIFFGLLCIILLRYTESTSIYGEKHVYTVLGKYLYLLIFIGAWSTDTGAYFVGVTMGKHKLIPDVSPKKTVEGAIGGLLGCIVGFSIYGGVLAIFYNVKVNWIMLIAAALVIGVVDQLGDLIASYIKRERGIKDFGNLFPGHGGVLDRFDSVIAIAPFMYFISILSPIQIFA